MNVQLTFTEMVSDGPISAIPNNATQTLTRELQAILIAAPYSSKIIFGVANKSAEALVG